VICIKNTCGQDSRNCKTPWTCGGYANEAHYSAMTAPIEREQEQGPKSADRRVPTWALWAALLAVIAWLAVIWGMR
jgi:hypothetical protein